MPDNPGQQNFLRGTAMLTLAAGIVKLMGAVYKIPLNAIIGEQGFGYFNTAYEIYNVLLMISTAGLPVAMSRMISASVCVGAYNQVRRIYGTALRIFLCLGITGSLVMTLFCRQLAEFQNQPDAWAAIGCLGPGALLMCMISTFRGFFQGQGNMRPTSVSQVLEAFVRLSVGISAAIVTLRITGSVPLASGGAMAGVTASCLVSAVYLSGCFRRAVLPKAQDVPLGYRKTAGELLSIALPITAGSAGLQILTMLETKVYMGRLLSMGISQNAADTMRGIYGMTQTVYNLPCGFITPITISMIPAITSRLVLHRPGEAREISESATRITGVIAMPCAFGLYLLSGPIMALLGGYRGSDLALATFLMAILSASLVFNAVVLVSTAILQAYGHARKPVVNLLFGGVLKLFVVFLLTGNPSVGILGTPVGTLVCYSVITVLNLFAVKKLPQSPRLLPNLLRPFLAGGMMGIFVCLTLWGMEVLGLSGRFLSCAVPMAVGFAAYMASAVKLKVITYADCLLLPGGEKIAKFFKL